MEAATIHVLAGAAGLLMGSIIGVVRRRRFFERCNRFIDEAHARAVAQRRRSERMNPKSVLRYTIGHACQTGRCGEPLCICNTLDQLIIHDPPLPSEPVPPQHVDCDCYLVRLEEGDA